MLMKIISSMLSFRKNQPGVSRNQKTCQSSLPVLALFLVASILLVCCGCTTDQEDRTHSKENLTIACTIPPEEEFIKAIGGDSVSVLVMVPPGASPHTFEPTPSQIAALESADLYVALGSGIEFEKQWISRIQELYPDMVVVNLSEKITLIPESEHHHEEESTLPEGEEESMDPHIWLSPRNAGIMVEEIGTAMSELRPGKKEEYNQNKDTYISRLSELDASIRDALRDLPSRIILVYHPAFGYFCQDYNLTQVAVEEGGHEPSAKSLADLISHAKTEHIKLVFTEPETSTRGAETLAKEINGTVVQISPLSGAYISNMQYIADTIAGI